MVKQVQIPSQIRYATQAPTNTNSPPLLAAGNMAESLAQVLAAAQAAATAEFNMEPEEEEEEEEAIGNAAEEEEEEGDEDDEDEDADIDAQAQEIALRLGQQLWEDINKAQAAQAALITASSQKPSRKEEAVISTMKTILSLIEQDIAAKTVLESTVLLAHTGNIFEILHRCVSNNSVDKHICTPLSHALVSLAKSENLFGGLRHSNIPSMELDKGKRRREEGDEGLMHRPSKRPHVLDGDLYAQVSEAVRVITSALGNAPPQALDPNLITSIRLQLHQVFLFAVTSSARGGHEMHALQEISGLIQVIGVLSGIQIGQPPETLSNDTPYPSNTTYPWMNHSSPFTPTTDIGTAVYPCLVAGCGKVFSRLYGLRAHQRGHSTHRPFRCIICPASFARNHDLKRHVKLHDKKAWRCEGCQKIFSRRDAIKRHKTGSKTRGVKSEICINADVVEVDLDDEGGEDSLREERRTKLWNSIVASGVNTAQDAHRSTGATEEGEIPSEVIVNTQAVVLGLQGLLQSYVGSALGTPQTQQVPLTADPTNGQATLASVIARAQLQSLPTKQIPDIAGSVTGAPMPNSIILTTSTANTDGQDVTMSPPNPADPSATPIIPSLSMYGLSDEQAKMLELAIANAASAAQAQAEAEAALEEEEEIDTSEGNDSDGTDDQETIS